MSTGVGFCWLCDFSKATKGLEKEIGGKTTIKEVSCSDRDTFVKPDASTKNPQRILRLIRQIIYGLFFSVTATRHH